MVHCTMTDSVASCSYRKDAIGEKILWIARSIPLPFYSQKSSFGQRTHG